MMSIYKDIRNGLLSAHCINILLARHHYWNSPLRALKVILVKQPENSDVNKNFSNSMTEV